MAKFYSGKELPLSDLSVFSLLRLGPAVSSVQSCQEGWRVVQQPPDQYQGILQAHGEPPLLGLLGFPQCSCETGRQPQFCTGFPQGHPTVSLVLEHLSQNPSDTSTSKVPNAPSPNLCVRKGHLRRQQTGCHPHTHPLPHTLNTKRYPYPYPIANP